MIQGIKNILYWFKVIWKDRWYDHSFLLTIIIHKLKHMERKFRSDGISVHNYQQADQMAQVVRLLTDVQNDVYSTIAYRKAEEQFGETLFEWHDIDDEYSELHITYPNKPDGMTDKEANHGCCELYHKGDRRQVHDLKKAFTLMRENILGWWD